MYSIGLFILAAVIGVFSWELGKAFYENIDKSYLKLQRIKYKFEHYERFRNDEWLAALKEEINK